MQGRHPPVSADADVIIDEDLEDADDEGEGGAVEGGSYGMTLGQYMSSMRTTPACPLSFSGLGEDEEAGSTATGSAQHGHPPAGGQQPKVQSAFTAPSDTAILAAAARPASAARTPAAAAARAAGEAPLTPTMSSVSVWKCESDSDDDPILELSAEALGQSSSTQHWEWPVQTLQPAVSEGRMSALNVASWSQSISTPSARAASGTFHPDPLDAPAFMKPALANSLDLRPGTALPASTPSLTRDLSIDTDPATKEVDLSALPTTLFTRSSPAPSADRPERLTSLCALPATALLASPSSPATPPLVPDHLMSSASVTSASDSSSCSTSITAPPGCTAAHLHLAPTRPPGALHELPGAAAAAAAVAAAAAGHSEPAAAGDDAAGAAKVVGAWATSRGGRPLDASDDALGSSDTGLHEEASSVAGRAASPNSRARRQIQSARPPGIYDQDLDPSVWHSLERPPSRQKPPPEALHLFTPGHEPPTGRPQRPAFPVRPKTAMAIRSSPSPSAPNASIVNQSIMQGNLHPRQRPPSRQKPPPMSVDLGHHQAQQRGQGAAACQHPRSCYKHIFTSDESDGDEEEEEVL